MLLDKAGRFRGQTIDAGLSESRNGYAQISLMHVVDQWWDGDQWVAMSEPAQITSYTFLEGEKGINQSAIENLSRVFEWDGVDLEYFNGNGALTDTQIETAMETWNDVTRAKVKWVNGYDDEGKGGVQHCDGSTLAKIKQRLGPQLRALAPAQPANASPSSSPAPAIRPAEPEPGDLADEAEKLKAWEMFCSWKGPDFSRVELVEMFQSTVLAQFGSDWRAIQKHIEGQLPF